MKTVAVQTIYLEMKQFVNYEVPPPSNCTVIQAKNPTTSFYKFLYKTIGKDWLWVNRLLMAEDELKAIISDSLVEIYVLYVDGVPAGYIELDRRIQNEIEIAYFGLMPEFIGRGLGKFLLCWGVRKAWSYNPIRIWLHTCELDHPAALPNYINAGFVVYKEESIQQKLLE